MSLELQDVVKLPDGTWRVAAFCHEPNRGLVVMEPIEPARGVSIVVPVTWVEALMPAPPLECRHGGAVELDVLCANCGEER